MVSTEIKEKGLDQWKDKTVIVHYNEGFETHISDRFTSEYMIGRITVGILIIEGNGDPQYNWTPQGQDSVTAQIIQGLDLLANMASQNNTNVCWFYEWRYSVPVNGEPITGTSGIEYNMDDNVVWWIAQAMSAIGYGSGDISAVYSYVRDLRYTYKTDWAFAIFVVNGNTFQDGYNAWAMRWQDSDDRIHGGSYLVMTRNSGPLGLHNMHRVLRHETCHVFGAADEYIPSDDCRNSDDCNAKWGYLQIENQNCYYCGPQDYCIMGHLFDGVLCGWSSYQLGWRDNDGDGPADPIDPNSRRYCWIVSVQPGDRVKIFTLPGSFVKFIAVTPDNHFLVHTMWDGTNAWGATCAPGLYLRTINDGGSESILLREVDPSANIPVFHNFNFQNGVLYWRLSDCWAYVRLKIYNSSNQLVLYPIKDKAYNANTDNQTEIYNLIEGATYKAKFFGWGPAGNVSQVTEYSFVYHGPAVLSPNGGEQWEAQTTHDITWNFQGLSRNVKIQYSTNGGSSWNTIRSSPYDSITPNDGVYSWTLPCSFDTLSACRIKVSDALDGIPWDVSDNDFSIVPHYISPPWGLTGSPSGPDEITLQWEYPLSPDHWFTVYCDGCLCGAVEPLDQTTYTDSGLIPDRSYVYWVKVDKPCTESAPSNADTVTLSSKLLFPSDNNIYPVDQSLTSLSSLPNPDTADVEILYTSAYPSHSGEVEVRLKNSMLICGFNFLIKFSNLDLIDFHTSKISKDSILIGSNWVHYPVRECLIDTAGSLISQRGFDLLASRGQVGDTTLSDCKYLWVKGWAKDSLITPWPNYRTLFKFKVDAHCIPDSSTDRTAYFYLTFGRLYSNYGDNPFRYHLGSLTVWWSVPGDANADSLVNMGDVTFMISYIYKNGPPPCIPEAGDANGDCYPNLGDVVHLISYLYKEGPPPVPGCWHGKN